MKFLSGKVAHQLDAKNRIRIPAKFKNAFPEHETLYYVEYAPDCITVMPESVLSEKLASFDEVDPGDPQLMLAKRRIMSSIDEVVEDAQGRAQLPRSFREYAGLVKDVVTVGMGSYIEIWSQERFERSVGGMSLEQANKLAYSKRAVLRRHGGRRRALICHPRIRSDRPPHCDRQGRRRHPRSLPQARPV